MIINVIENICCHSSFLTIYPLADSTQATLVAFLSTLHFLFKPICSTELIATGKVIVCLVSVNGCSEVNVAILKFTGMLSALVIATNCFALLLLILNLGLTYLFLTSTCKKCLDNFNIFSN